MVNKILGLVFLLCIFSCKEKIEDIQIQKEKPIEVNHDEVRTISTMTTNYDTLINRVKKRGDTDAYDELFYSFKDCCFDQSTDSVMVYSMIMAEKYHYERAYFDYFSAFCEKNNVEENYQDFSKIDISKTDKVSKKQAEDWLRIMLSKKLITQEDFNNVKR